MNYPIIFRLLGVITAAIGLAFLCCISVGLCYKDPFEVIAFRKWGGCFTATAILAIIFFILGRNASPKMLRKDGLCVIGLGWILATLIGALPFFLFINEFNVFDALFESASGLTTTGASLVSEPESMPHSLLFWRSMTQWIGGLGIVVFFVAILSSLGVGAKILYSNEASGQVAEMDSGRIQKGILAIMLVYLGISAICALTFYILGMNLFDSVCHMFATVSTGGFSTHSASIAYFQSPAIEWATIIFMTLGGTSFFLLLQIINFKWNLVIKNTEFLTYLGVLLTFTLVLAFVIHIKTTTAGVESSVRTSAFQVVSIMTTTGFNTINFDTWVPAAQVFLMMLMVSGASSGSTAGGMKLIRIVIAVKTCLFNIEKSFRAHIVRTIKINQKPLETNAEEPIMIFIVMGTIIFFISLFLLAIIQTDLSFKGLFSAVLTCISNVGPGFAELGPTKTFDFLHNESKFLLTLVMILGRLEFYAILTLFLPSFWKRFS